MHHFRSIRRAALGAALAAGAIGAVPSLASAAGATNCSYTSSGGGVVTVNADPNVNDLTLAVVGQFITVSTDATPQTACIGSGTFALTVNTNRIQVFTNINVGAFRGGIGYHIDESQGAFGPGATPESDGNSEIETTIFTNAPSSSLDIVGTPQRDIITFGGNTRGDVNFGADSDIDLSITSRTSPVTVSGGDGDDFISGNGNPSGVPGPSTALTTLRGGPGNDTIIGGTLRDHVFGGADNDSLRTSGGSIDEVQGGAGFDDAVVDPTDTPVAGVESVSTVGRLRLAPTVVKAEAGETARLEMGWKHPKSWRELRKVMLTVRRGKRSVGMINARPAAGRLSSTGAVELMPGSKLGHHGKWVTAELAMRLPRSLAGQSLRVDVTAVDRQGHKQVERDAGTIRIAA